jgi:hypothetical protein
MLARLPTALRAVSAAALVVGASGALVRTISAAFDPFEAYPGHTSDYGVARSRALRAALPAIVERPQESVILLGSSGLARAFVPSVFDAALGAGHDSFNLAQLLLQPETALAMATVIRRTYESKKKRIWITFFGVSVPELVRDSLRAARSQMPDQAFAFGGASVATTAAHADLLGTLDDQLQFAVFGNVRTGRVGLWLEDWLEGGRSPCESGLKQPPEGEEAQAALSTFCTELHEQFPRGVPPWNPGTRGAIDFGLPATRPVLARLIELQPKPVDLPLAAAANPSQKAPDNIDEEAIRMMIAALRELEAVSDHTFVLRDIMNPAGLASVPPAQLVQWREVAARIAHEGDAPLLDLNDGTFVASDFGDRTHLHPLAAERFSVQLAQQVRPYLQADRASH